MIKLFFSRNEKEELSLHLEGGIKIKEDSILPYDLYVSREQDRLLKEEIEKFLNKIFPNPYPKVNIHLFGFDSGYDKALQTISNYLFEQTRSKNDKT